MEGSLQIMALSFRREYTISLLYTDGSVDYTSCEYRPTISLLCTDTLQYSSVDYTSSYIVEINIAEKKGKVKILASIQ